MCVNEYNNFMQESFIIYIYIWEIVLSLFSIRETIDLVDTLESSTTWIHYSSIMVNPCRTLNRFYASNA